MNPAIRGDIGAGPGETRILQSASTEDALRPYRHSLAPHKLSLTEFAEEFQRAVEERDALAGRLRAAIEEMEDLRRQLVSFPERGAKSPAEPPGLKSVLAAREKVIREEFERKFLELTVQVRQERHKYTQAIQRIKDQRSSCICQSVL